MIIITISWPAGRPTLWATGGWKWAKCDKLSLDVKLETESVNGNRQLDRFLCNLMPALHFRPPSGG